MSASTDDTKAKAHLAALPADQRAALRKLSKQSKAAAPGAEAQKPGEAKRAADGAAAVDALFESLDHPQKNEIAAVRAILKKAGPPLAERVKWNAPSTYLRTTDFSAFNLRAKGFVQLILLFPKGVVADETGILEGKWPDRRFVSFADASEVRRKKAALTAIVKAWVALEGS